MKFDHDCFVCNSSYLDMALSDYSKQGWELVSVIYREGFEDREYMLFFKKQVEEAKIRKETKEELRKNLLEDNGHKLCETVKFNNDFVKCADESYILYKNISDRNRNEILEQLKIIENVLIDYKSICSSGGIYTQIKDGVIQIKSDLVLKYES